MNIDLKIDYIPMDQLVPYIRHARTHSKKKIQKLAKSIQAFGFICPILVDESGTVVAGHARLLAAKQLNLNVVPVIRTDHLSEDEQRAYRLADNKLAEDALWADGLLKIELEYLTQVDCNVDVDLTGFSMGEIDILLGAADQPMSEDPPPPPPDLDNTVTQPGDIWQLGPHRVICADCRSEFFINTLMDFNHAQMVITDPPYNVPINGHVSGLGSNKHEEFAMACGEMTSDEFSEFLFDTLLQLERVCTNGALLYVFMDWRHQFELLIARQQLQIPLINMCIWVKNNGGMGSFYRSQHELVYIFKHGSGLFTNNVELGKHGRYRTNVWNYPGVNSFGEGRDEALAMHPTVKPVAMIADAILDATNRGDIVLDGFLGSGTTLMAASQTGRVCYGVEIDPRYVDVAVHRWEEATGEVAIHEQSSVSFEDVAICRPDPLSREV